MILRYINKYLFDVFWDTGWNNWARIQNNNGFLKQIAGKEIPRNIFSQLIELHSKDKNG